MERLTRNSPTKTGLPLLKAPLMAEKGRKFLYIFTHYITVKNDLTEAYLMTWKGI